jgi:large subunit ribosomal protein L29
VKAFDLRELTADELQDRLAETKAELFNLRFQLATNQLDDASRIREVRKDVARILTVLREQEIRAWREQEEE